MGLFVVAACVVFLFVPSSTPRAVLEREVFRADATGLQDWQAEFEIDAPIPRLRVWVTAADGVVSLILTLAGPPGVYLLADFPVNTEEYRFWCGRDLPAGRYTLRVHEQMIMAGYRVEVARPARFPFHLRSLVLLGFMALLSIVLWLRSVSGGRTGITGSRTMRCVVAFGGSGICVLLIYLLFHEGGHAVLALLFGTLDLGQSDPFGFSGRPHISYREGHVLTDWQILTRAAAGPLVPTFVGFVSFVLWRSKWGRRIRSVHKARDIMWSLFTFGLLMGQIGMLLPVTRLAHDGDYDTIVRHSPVSVWVIDGAFALLAIVAMGMVSRIIRDMIALVRAALRAPNESWWREGQVSSDQT